MITLSPIWLLWFLVAAFIAGILTLWAWMISPFFAIGLLIILVSPTMYFLFISHPRNVTK